MNLRTALEKLKFDNRMIELNIRAGLISREDVEKQLAQLEDTQSNAAPLQIDENESGNGSYQQN